MIRALINALEWLDEKLITAKYSIIGVYYKYFPKPDTRTQEQKDLDNLMAGFTRESFRIASTVAEGALHPIVTDYVYDDEFSKILGEKAFSQSTIRVRMPIKLQPEIK